MQAGLNMIDITQTGEDRNDRRVNTNGSYSSVHGKSERNRAAGRRRRKVRLIGRVVAALFGVAVCLTAANFIRHFHSVNPEYEAITESYQPNRPKMIETYEALNELEQQALKYPEFEEIYNSAQEYPEKLIAALCNNPEMYEFVKGYPQSDGTVSGGISSQELDEDYPLFLQWDRRWGYYAYGDSMIGLAGCGPTCLSMVIVSLTKNAEATPDRIASYSMNHGHYVEGTGTAWSLMTDAVSDYGITAKTISLDESIMKKNLDSGSVLICSVGAGDFTASGHFIVIYGHKDGEFLVNDPNCIERSGRTWSFDELSHQIRGLWSYSI